MRIDMSTRNTYSRNEESNEHFRRSPEPPRETSSTQTYIAKKGTHSKMKENEDLDTGISRRTSSSHDLDQSRSSDCDKNSDSYYSDDYDATYGSDRSQTPSTTRSPHTKKVVHKIGSVTPLKNQGLRKVGCKFPLNKKEGKWGIRSQSLNKESPSKDIDLVTKRVLSARLLKINELRNELTDHQTKLKELQNENKILKRLQFRQEKALTKFEDTENEISQLISRHNNEIRTLRDRLRKSQERERNMEKRLKDAEEELYRTNNTLKKLKQLSENRNLAEREELTKKLDIMESKLDEKERRVKDLEKNLELTQSSFQRQLLSEKKKAHDAQEENKTFQEELQRLTQKLKEKERELHAKNIYAYRLSKPLPKNNTEITPRRKGTSQSTSIGIQTNETALLMESFPTPPPPVVQADSLELTCEEALKVEQKHLKRLLKGEVKYKREKERAEQKMEEDRNGKEQNILEDKAQKLHEEWEIDEPERQKNKLEKENTEEERHKKELLLAKMFEIDRENEGTEYFDTFKGASQTSPFESSLRIHTPETKYKIYKLSDPTQKVPSGLPVQGSHEASSKLEAPGHINENRVDPKVDISFGSYAPSFGKGRSSGSVLNNEDLDETIISTAKLNIQKERKPNLMEQLFGSGPSTTLPTIAKHSDSKASHDASSIRPWEKSSEIKVKNDLFSGEDKTGSSNRHRSQLPAGRPVVKAVGSFEDEIEEVVLR
ncbi:hypothetical protein XENTR_v10014228 [Xenopus tropicalis]|uniref:Lebercilin n=1 Tax=Xenopus tropicalis TaxID=8364 RepID=A0A6I8PV29_XENTR|nr:lebercilin [Xenopus tropicalis]KAE8603126.1 hypothetical protein XENTR_v10014228 [Xenopus tropicalis]KAE8603127.1 hypothetical protein XENTR_v10014228 [Xenopus tropicalis]